MIEIDDWEKTSFFDLKYRGVNPRRFELVGVGTTSNPKYLSDLDDIVLIQLSLFTITLQLLSLILVNAWKVAPFL